MRFSILAASVFVALPLAAASAQTGPSISGFAPIEVPPPPPPAWMPAEPPPVEVRPALPPPAWPETQVIGEPQRLTRWSETTREMPPDWRPGYPGNAVPSAVPPARTPYDPPGPPGIPQGPRSSTFNQPAVEAPGAYATARSENRHEAAVQLLLDNGYSRINAPEPDGSGFTVFAELEGRPMRLYVNPDTREIQRLPDL